MSSAPEDGGGSGCSDKDDLPPPLQQTDTATSRSSTRTSDALTVPPPEELQRIATRQDAKAQELRAARREASRQQQQQQQQRHAQQRREAATMIQKNYRGYRARRELGGYGLDPSTRWLEALRAAKYQNSTQPRSRLEHQSLSATNDGQVRSRWRRAGAIAQHAGYDDTSASEADEVVEDEEERRRQRERRRSQKAEREKFANVMGLEYFLEMVDHKHRYGSNLRRYHAEWKKADTTENFFYWLDHGEGRELDLEDRPRRRLDTEQVRYLSREERQRYLVMIEDGRLCWAKNGLPVTTSAAFRDSINGIVPEEDETPTWREVMTGQAPEPSPPGSPSSSDSDSSGPSIAAGSSEAADDKLRGEHGLSKAKRITTAAVAHHKPSKASRGSPWIFVADTSFRMYVGIKQSGAFQHSSFVGGARVSAAGQIKVKAGQLRKLSPLSGHYAPPLRNFREFLRSLRDEGTDLSRLNTSRSYAVLLGLEAYLATKRRARAAEQGMRDVVDPEGRRQREAAALDQSKSAQREREVLEAQERERQRQSFSHRLLRRLGLGDDDTEAEVGSTKTQGVGRASDKDAARKA